MRWLCIFPLFVALACNGSKKVQENNVYDTEEAFEELEKSIEEEEAIDEGPKPIEPSIVFGLYCGHCVNNCVSLYKVGPNTYEGWADKSNNLTRKGQDSLNFNMDLNMQECMVAQEIRNILPMELYSMEGQTFGCPDCMDQCGYFVQIIPYDGVTKTFRIDTQKEALPDFLNEFPSQIEDILKRLKPLDK